MNQNSDHAAEPGDATSVLQLTAPGSGLTTIKPWSQQLHDQWADTVEQADRYNWQIAARIEPGPRTLIDSDRIPLLKGAIRTLLQWQNEPRRTCIHVADNIVPSILMAVETPVEVCFSEPCLTALLRVIDTEQFYGEHCSLCGNLGTPARLELVHIPIPWGQFWMLCCDSHFVRRANV